MWQGNVKRLEANLADRTAQVAALRKRLAASRPAKEVLCLSKHVEFLDCKRLMALMSLSSAPFVGRC
jgi:hypothetical protein